MCRGFESDFLLRLVWPDRRLLNVCNGMVEGTRGSRSGPQDRWIDSVTEVLEAVGTTGKIRRVNVTENFTYYGNFTVVHQCTILAFCLAVYKCSIHVFVYNIIMLYCVFF